MPVTPVYGFPYPEITDPVDPGAFCTLADLIDAQLNRFNTDLAFAKDRPYAGASSVFVTTYAVGVETQISLNTPFVDNAGMFNPGTPDRFTITRKGIYLAVVWGADVGSYTTLTSSRFAIYQAGILRYAERKFRNNGSNSNRGGVQGMLRCEVGDTVDVRVLWTGTGGPGRVTSLRFTLRYLAPVV